MPFELFDRRNAPLAKAPSVTIQKRGIFSISKAAHKLIDEAETVELLFDKEAQIIAMRSSEPSPHAYAIRPQSERAGAQVILSATAFTQYYNIDTTVSRRYEPYLAEGMLCINLTGPSAVVRGNRAAKESTEAAEEASEDVNDDVP